MLLAEILVFVGICSLLGSILLAQIWYVRQKLKRTITPTTAKRQNNNDDDDDFTDINL